MIRKAVICHPDNVIYIYPGIHFPLRFPGVTMDFLNPIDEVRIPTVDDLGWWTKESASRIYCPSSAFFQRFL